MAEAGKRIEDRLRDGSAGPQLVVVPAGIFEMGSPHDEHGRYADEGPLHKVYFARPFALGHTEVTVGQFRKFVESTGYVTSAERGEGSLLREANSGDWRLREEINWRHDQSGSPAEDHLPVVHVSWQDAQAYIKWLSGQTGEQYRLPSEAEFEYANRAGSQTAFWWGGYSPPVQVANLRGEIDVRMMPKAIRTPLETEVEYVLREGPTPLVFHNYNDDAPGVSPVASYRPNAFGLHDTTGNVWEWTQDCWHENYEGAPADGRAWVEGNRCGERVIRGGSWYCFPRHARSANRWAERRFFRNMYIGFRVARDL
jgi:formylglycine-generating enzyme required for sulfatase activity